MKRPVYAIDFDAVPPVGTVIIYFGHSVELVSAEPYARADGTPSVVLNWKAADGRIGKSGLRSKSLTWAPA